MNFPIELSKKNGKTKIIIDIDKDMSDPWFIKISYRWIKSDKEFNANTIIRKDVERYLSMVIKEGYNYKEK
jgi:hypothetical protein